MTPEERDVLRAEASMRILAAMYVNFIPPPEPPRDVTEEKAKAMGRAIHIREMERACWAVTQANALITELELREEFHANDPDTVAGLVAAGIAAGGKILSCKHGRTSFEDCPACDADEAMRIALEKKEETGKVAEPGNL